MTDQAHPQVSEALIERMLIERAGAGAPVGLVSGITEVVGSTRQRPARPFGTRPTPFQAPPFLLRLAAAALITAVAVGGAFYLSRPTQPATGGPTAVPSEGSSSVKPDLSSWSSTGKLLTARSGHTATLLPDGKVLVAGGHLGNQVLATAEIYDPTTGTWAATGNMVTPRFGHTATLLPDGKVLVAGGGSAIDPSAELYDPRTGTWSVTGTMVVRRSLQTATLLPNGKVLVAGGFDTTTPPGIGGSQQIVATAELYDPTSGTWAATGSMSTSRRDHTATLLLNGQVLVVGGYRNAKPGGDERGPEGLDTAEVYDPATGNWAATGGTPFPFVDAGATLLRDGTVLVEYGDIEDVELFDPGSGSWTRLVYPDIGGFVTATLLGDGTVLTTFALRDVALFDPATRAWTYIISGDTTFGAGATATLLRDGTVLLAGGEANTAALYHPGSGR
jgi:WD40 repeat protein